MARTAGFEPATVCLEGRCSIQLSYALAVGIIKICWEIMVGETGFEPATPWTQTKCATKLRHSPKKSAHSTDLHRLGQRLFWILNQ